MSTFPGRTNRAIIASGVVAAAGLTLLYAAPDAIAAASAHGKPTTAASRHPVASAHGKSSSGTDPASTASGNGDNGDVKIHNAATAVTDHRNEPHVCVFYLDAFNFDAGQSVSWRIKSWPPTGNRSVVASGALVLDSAGNGHTVDMTLQNGHYKLFWNFTGENGFAKQKVFWVACPGQAPSPMPKPKPKKKHPARQQGGAKKPAA